MAKPDFEGMVAELLAYDLGGDMPRLTEWEIGFLDDVRNPRKADFGGAAIGWTPLQVKKLEEIWERVFG